jgi:hypothetical protein
MSLQGTRSSQPFGLSNESVASTHKQCTSTRPGSTKVAKTARLSSAEKLIVASTKGLLSTQCGLALSEHKQSIGAKLHKKIGGIILCSSFYKLKGSL